MTIYLIIAVTPLFHAGCGEKYKGGLEYREIYKEVETIKKALKFGNLSEISGDTLNIEGYIVDYLSTDSTEYTVLSLAEPDYYGGSFYTTSYTDPQTGFTHTSTHKTNASMSFRKTDALYALNQRLPKTKKLYIFPAQLTEDVIDYKGKAIVVAKMTRRAPSYDIKKWFPERVASLKDVQLYKKKKSPLERHLDEKITEKQYPTPQSAILPPLLPIHLYNLDGKVFFLCKSHYPLDDYMAPVPVGFRLESDWKNTAKAYKKIMQNKDGASFDISISDAEKMYNFANASNHVSKAEEYLLGEKRILYIGVDRENAVQKRCDSRASKLMSKAIECDTLWEKPYFVFIDNLIANDKPASADNVFDLAMRRQVADSAAAAAYGRLKRDGSSWFSEMFRWRRKLKEEPVRSGRKWRLGIYADMSTRYDWEISCGILGSYNITKDISLEPVWTPLSLGKDLLDGPGITIEKTDFARPDRYSMEVRYQIPLRIQFWKYGYRLHVVSGAAHYSRYESFRMPVENESRSFESEAKGWVAKLGIGLTSRKYYTKNDKRYHRFEIGYLFGKSKDLETTSDGQQVILISTEDNKPVQYDPKGFYLSCYYLF